MAEGRVAGLSGVGNVSLWERRKTSDPTLRLGVAQRRLLAVIRGAAAEFGRCPLSVAALARKAGVSYGTAVLQREKLGELGLIEGNNQEGYVLTERGHEALREGIGRP